MTIITFLQAIEHTFHRKTMLIAEYVHHIMQRISFQIINSIANAKVRPEASYVSLSGSQILFESIVEYKRLEYLWNHENMFETGVV